MSSLSPAFQLLPPIFARWVNRQQLDVIEYLQEETCLLKERLGDRCMQFTDAERRRQSIRAKRSGRKVLNELNTLATPDTLIRWYRDLMGAKWECFVRSIKEECLSRMISFGQASLRHGVKHFMAHCYAERNHQGLGNRLLQSISASAPLNRRVRQCQRLGGMLSYYYREAA